MSQVHKKGSAKATANLTPLIDVVFQLILFFMLVNNIIADESMKLIVPQIHDPQTQEMDPEAKKVIISVAGAKDYKDADRMANPLAFEPRMRVISVGAGGNWDLSTMTLEDALDQLEDFLKAEKAKNENVEVVLRCDAALHYSEIEPVMGVITGQKIGTVNIVAILPE